MSATSNVLREYLVSLGFKIDGPGQKKFDMGLGKINTTALGLGKTLLGVASSAQAMVGVFAVQMEKLYYSSKKAESTASNLQAMEFGAKNIGISGDAMRSSIEGMARAMRANPGLKGLLNSLGVKVEGRDKSDVMMDMVAALKRFPPHVANQYAALFGIDADTLFLMQDGLEKMKEAAAARKQMAADAGIDSDEAAKAGMEYANAMKEVYERVMLLKDAFAMALLPFFKDSTKGFNSFLTDLTKVIGKIHSLDDLMTRFGRGWDRVFGSGAAETQANTPRGRAMSAMTGGDPKTGVIASSKGSRVSSGAITDDTATGGSSKQEKLAGLEKKYGLPTGLLDALWDQESGRGKNTYNAKSGARGDFQFMPSTAKEFGVDTNSFDSSADGAARKMKGLLKYYKGDLMKAVTGYNAGEGILDNVLGGKGDKRFGPEAQAYGPSVLGKMGIQQTNHITVTGVSDPKKAANEIKIAMQTTNADLLRNQKVKVQ